MKYLYATVPVVTQPLPRETACFEPVMPIELEHPLPLMRWMHAFCLYPEGRNLNRTMVFIFDNNSEKGAYALVKSVY